MKLEIKRIAKYMGQYNFQLYVNEVACGIFISEEGALKEGCKKLLSMETFDFGEGPVPAHKHPNGGGWVADTAYVGDTVFVGPDARVHGFAKICDYVRILGKTRVYGRAQLYNHVVIKDQAKIFGTTIIGGNVEICNNVCFDAIKISDGKITRNV